LFTAKAHLSVIATLNHMLGYPNWTHSGQSCHLFYPKLKSRRSIAEFKFTLTPVIPQLFRFLTPVIFASCYGYMETSNVVEFSMRHLIVKSSKVNVNETVSE